MKVTRIMVLLKVNKTKGSTCIKSILLAALGKFASEENRACRLEM